MLHAVNRDDITPLCPHCQAGLTGLFFQELQSTFGRRYIYFCPHCSKVLGVSHRKGFWMG
ncbi:MAG: hypothetical protein RBT76_10820 [candidate division Zixibacteria bacterium]|jgi:hypothetical protein|nr:hypothetical protein [candidate division Zixibacteria bacterium]